jgi:hypothetical protein
MPQFFSWPNHAQPMGFSKIALKLHGIDRMGVQIWDPIEVDVMTMDNFI